MGIHTQSEWQHKEQTWEKSIQCQVTFNKGWYELPYMTSHSKSLVARRKSRVRRGK